MLSGWFSLFSCRSTPDIVNYRATALEQLQQLACSPSVPMQDVPRETLGQHLGFGRDEEEGRDELDERLARQYFLR